MISNFLYIQRVCACCVFATACFVGCDSVTKNDVAKNDVAKNDVTANDVAANDVAANDMAANDMAKNDAAADGDSQLLTIGSKAPDIDIEHWVSDGDGEFPHVTQFSQGKVYVIEFWATWCGPCISSMPHLSELQQKYADKGVEIISISDEELDVVEEFLEGTVRGEETQTYGELTNNYCLTADPDESVKKDYFQAAGQTGIPCAFVVGKSGLVEWIGHPIALDEPLEAIVSDDWDRAAFLVQREKEKVEKAKMLKLRQRLTQTMKAVAAKRKDGKPAEALQLVDELIVNDDFEVAKPFLENTRTEILIFDMGGDKGVEALRDFGQANAGKPGIINRLTWAIYTKHIEEKVDEGILAAAIEVTEIGVNADPNDGALLDTLAHLYHASDNLEKALEMQEKALENPGGSKAEIEAFLKQLREELKNKEN